MVSDLFTERTQFEMMYLTLAELRRVHPLEDEILIQYLVPATCKAAAVLGMVSERQCRGCPHCLGPCVGQMCCMHVDSQAKLPGTCGVPVLVTQF